MRLLRRRVRFLLLLLIVAVPLRAQQAEVTHNVNLRSDPSTNNPPIGLLKPPEQVELLEPGKTAGYYHVRTAANEEGWVWSHNVKVLETTPSPTPAFVPTPTPTTPKPSARPRPEATGPRRDRAESPATESCGSGGDSIAGDSEKWLGGDGIEPFRLRQSENGRRR